MRFGPGILGALGAVTGVFVNNHYRTRLRLAKFGFVSSYVPIVVLPAIMASLFHRTFIQSAILLPKEQCPLCLQLRAAAFQGFFGTVYPSILAPLASYMVCREEDALSFYIIMLFKTNSLSVCRASFHI